VVDPEAGGDVGAGRALAHRAGVGPCAEREAERIDQDGLAGAGLARQDAEALAELDLGRIDDDEVAQSNAFQHRGEGLRSSSDAGWGTRASTACCAAWRNNCSPGDGGSARRTGRAPR